MTTVRASISARIALMDKQIVDRDRLPIGRVDDAELQLPDDGGPPYITALRIGAQALGERLGGSVGGTMAAAAARLRTDPSPAGLDVSLVEHLEPMVAVRARLADLPQIAPLERWLAQRIQRAPGAGDAPQ